MTSPRICLYVVGAALLSAASSNATILVNEQFTTDGALVGMTPSPGPGGAWAALSGAGSKPIQVSAGWAVLEQSGGSGEDDQTSYAARGATDTTYARFDFSLPSALNTGVTNVDSSGLYFTTLNVGSSYRARTGIVAPSSGGDFGLAINADNADLGAGTTWASDLSFDTTYRVVISYDAATGGSQLWLNPVDMASTSISDGSTGTGTLIDAILLRQSNDYTGQQLVDNIVVATTFGEALSGVAVPEPSTFALAGFGALALLMARRKN